MFLFLVNYITCSNVVRFLAFVIVFIGPINPFTNIASVFSFNVSSVIFTLYSNFLTSYSNS